MFVSFFFANNVFAVGPDSFQPTSPKTSSGTYSGLPKAVEEQRQPEVSTTDASCGWVDFICQILGGALWAVLATIVWIIFKWALLLLWLATTVVDLVIYLFVLNMSGIVNHKSAEGIRIAWMIIRDLMNIFIIAGFVIVGLSTIVGSQAYNANRFLVRLIIAALLVNFSYFFAGAIIDSTNYVAYSVYTSNLMKNACDASHHPIKPPKTQGEFISGQGLCSWSSHLTASLGLGSWTDLRVLLGGRGASSGPLDGWGSAGADLINVDLNRKLAVVGTFGAIFMFILGSALFSVAILLVGRFVALILLLVTSPIGIAGMNIPFLDKYAQKWWDALWGQALFAPVFFILIAISLTVINGLKEIIKNADNSSLANIGSGVASDAIGAAPFFVVFIVAIGFVYASVHIATQMSEQGKEFFGAIYSGLNKNFGSIYGNLYNATAGKTIAGVRGLAGAGYDNTLGRVGAALNRNAANVPLVGPLLSNLVGGPLVGLGVAVRNANKEALNEKPFGATKSVAEQMKEGKEYVDSIPPVSENERALQGAIKILKSGGTLSPEQESLVRRMVPLLSDEEIKKLPAKTAKALAGYMTSAQAQTYANRNDISRTERQTFTDARFKEVFDAAREHGWDSEEAKALLKDMDITDHKLLMTQYQELRNSKEFLRNVRAENHEAYMKDPASTPYRKDVTTARESGQREALTGQAKGKDGKLLPDDVRASATAAAVRNMTEGERRKAISGSDDAVAGTVIDNSTPEQIRKVYDSADASTQEIILRRLQAQNRTHIVGRPQNPTNSEAAKPNDGAKK